VTARLGADVQIDPANSRAHEATLTSEAESRIDRPYILAPGAPRRHPPWYSRFVTLMKIVLPAVAVALVVLIWAWPYLQSKDLRFRIGFSGLAATQGEDPSMVNPRYLGTDKNQQPFSISADIARTQADKNTNVELEMPKGDIMLKDGTWLVLTAASGVYERTAKTLDLTGAVTLFHDTGYEIRTQSARVDLEQGSAEGQEPVRGQGPFGDLHSEGFRLVDKGETIFLVGKSKVVFYPGAQKSWQ
jgi:lipopolysaccharide export system protein LptC